MTDPSPTREELKKRLRAKINGARTSEDNAAAAKQIRTDPMGALLRMGVEDPKLLEQATTIVSNPKLYLKTLRKDTTAQPTITKTEDDNDDEAPPPLL